jgi:hypothetical protein
VLPVEAKKKADRSQPISHPVGVLLVHLLGSANSRNELPEIVTKPSQSRIRTSATSGNHTYIPTGWR